MPKVPENFGGKTATNFKRVEDAFRQNFSTGWEEAGAAVAVYYKGELVVDLWGGYADRESGRKWQANTMTMVYSSTKALCALSVMKLVDEGHLSYDDLVTKHWPEFGQNGKEKITVFELISHMAGLAAPDEKIRSEHLNDWKKMGEIFEKQKPNWTLGEGTIGYHALTYGFPIDQLVRRVDAKQRSVGQYIQEELINSTGPEEFYLGLPLELEHRVARQSKAGKGDLVWHVVHVKELRGLLLKMATGKIGPVGKEAGACLEEITFDDPKVNQMNAPEWHAVEIGAANGIGTARGLAQPFSALATGKLIKNKELIDRLNKPVNRDKVDLVIGVPLNQGHGYMYMPQPGGKADTWTYGHPGFGGQNVMVDIDNQLSIAYVTNSLKSAFGDYARTYAALKAAVYESIK